MLALCLAERSLGKVSKTVRWFYSGTAETASSREEASETASYGQGTSMCVPHKCVTIVEVVLFT